MNIRSNGSKWNGQAPDPLSTLLDLLKVEPLDPRFYPFASNIEPGSGGGVQFLGNFYRVSHVFNIEFDASGGPGYEALLAAVADNIRSRAHLDARLEIAPYVTHARHWTRLPGEGMATDGGAS